MSRDMTKPTKWVCAQRRLRSAWAAWRKLGSLATHGAHSEDSDQTVRMPRLIWVFAGCIVTLLVLLRGGTYVFMENYRKLSFNNLQIPSISVSLQKKKKKKKKKKIPSFWCASFSLILSVEKNKKQVWAKSEDPVQTTLLQEQSD